MIPNKAVEFVKRVSTVLQRLAIAAVGILAPYAMVYAAKWGSDSYPDFFATQLGGSLWFLWIILTLFVVGPVGSIVAIAAAISGDEDGFGVAEA